MTNLPSLLEQSFAQQMRGLNFAKIGKVVAYDAASQRASVQPVLARALSTGTSEQYPVIEDVPVMWPRAGGASITFPVKPGDGCLLLFTDSSLDAWKQSGDTGAAGDNRQHALSDAVAIMGVVSFGDGGGSPDSAEITMGETVITLASGAATIKAPTVTIDAPTTTVQGNMTVVGSLNGQGGMTVTGNVTVEGSLGVQGGGLSHNGTNVGDDHVHGGIEPGSSTTDGPE